MNWNLVNILVSNFFKNFLHFFKKLFLVFVYCLALFKTSYTYPFLKFYFLQLHVHTCNIYIYIKYIVCNIYTSTINTTYNLINYLNTLLFKSLCKFPIISTILLTLQQIIYIIYTYIYNIYIIYVYSILLFFWKSFINFLFFKIYKNITFLKNFITLLVFILLIFIVLYCMQYTYYIIMYFYPQIENNFICWDLDNSSYKHFFIIIAFFNIKYLLLFVYILLHSIMSNIFFLRGDDFFLNIGYLWLVSFLEFKSGFQNNYFLPSTFCEFYQILGLTISSDFNLKNSPLFFFFGIFFFTTVILSWVFFSYLGLYGIFRLNILSLFFFLVSLLFSAKSILINQKIYVIKLSSWIFLSTNVKIDYYFLIDTISFSFMLLTTVIAFFVFIYAFSYFRYEPLVDRFLLFVLSFVVSMIFLVISGNTIMLFLGWELIGLTSFCLINFWVTKAGTLKSAFKAFTFNKVSDFFMFMFLIATFSMFYTFDILSINNQVFKFESVTVVLFNSSINFNEFLAIMLIGAASIKSAQLGGHVWLPDSMEAPVPASSLIHSATLVSAGIYLILRFNFIFDCTQYCKLIIPVMGSLTAAYGGVCAIAQSDIKKTLAYSTISHCGFLMVLCATEMNEFTILYLYVHGFFKAGVFMCVGNVLRISHGYQDTRKMGGLLKYLPFEYFCAIIGVINLAGLPFTFGFFIKHLLLISLEKHMYVYYFVIFHSLVGAFAGLFYSYRLITYTFTDFKKGNKLVYNNLNCLSYNSLFYTNSSTAATLSILFLFIFSYIIIFCLFKYLLAGNFIFSDFMNTTLLSNYYSTVYTSQGVLLNFSYINITVLFIILGLYFSKYKHIQYVYLNIRVLFTLFTLFTLVFFLIF